MSLACRCDFALTPTRSLQRGAKFALFPRSELAALIGRHAPPAPAPWPQGEVAFFVEGADAEYARLRAAGVPVLASPTDRPWGGRTLHVADPDGNVGELTRAKQPAEEGERGDELTVWAAGGRSGRVGQRQLLVSVMPEHGAEPVSLLDAGRGVELERAVESRRSQHVGGGARIVGSGLVAVRGDQRRSVGLSPHVVELHAARSRLAHDLGRRRGASGSWRGCRGAL